MEWVFLGVAVVLAVIGMRSIAQGASNKNNSSDQRNDWRVKFGLLLWALSLVSIQSSHPWTQSVFIWLGLLSMVGIGWVFLNPKRRS